MPVKVARCRAKNTPKLSLIVYLNTAVSNTADFLMDVAYLKIQEYFHIHRYR